MATLGIELCDAGFQTAKVGAGGGPELLPAGGTGPLDCLGLAYHDGRKPWFGPPAEEAWYVRPKQISHDYWSRLSRDASALGLPGKPLSFSQLAYFNLRDYYERVTAAAGAPDKLMLAVPGEYLKDALTEDERIGLLLGMAAELKLPLVGIADMACAALCDPRLGPLDRSLPVLVVDVHLHNAELTLFRHDAQLVRHGYACLPHLGHAELLRQVMTTMGNRFLRHTTFDIQEDGRVEQIFYRQTKDFLLSGSAEQHYQLNTGNRAYEMNATREQLAADTVLFGQALVQGVLALLPKGATGRPERCTLALTARAALLPGIAGLFRNAGMTRFLSLPSGAAAAGAACLGDSRTQLEDLSDLAVDTAVPSAFVAQRPSGHCEVRLVKSRRSVTPQRPSHAICEGAGHALDNHVGFTIGTEAEAPDLVLPEDFNASGTSCFIRLELTDGHWWLMGGDRSEPGERIPLESGDRLALRLGGHETEVLFAFCPEIPALRRRA